MAHVQECKNGVSCKHYSAGKCKFNHPTLKKVAPKEGKTLQPKNLKPKLTNDSIIYMGRAVLRRKSALEALKSTTLVKTEPPKGYVLVPDAKSPQLPTSDGVAALQELYDSELKMARAAIGQMLGTKAIPFILPVPIAFVSTVTTGLVTTVLSLAPDLATEWSSLAAIFDEYRAIGGRYDFYISCVTTPTVMGTSGLSTGGIASLCYDPSDATAVSGNAQVAQHEQHKMYYPRLLATSASATANSYVGCFNNTNGKPLEFHWKTGQCATFSGNGGAIGVGMWKSTQGNVSSFPDGTLKPFWQAGTTLATDIFVGLMYFHFHFRMRT